MKWLIYSEEIVKVHYSKRSKSMPEHFPANPKHWHTLREITDVAYRAIKQVLQKGIDQGVFINEDIETLSFGVMSNIGCATQLCLTMPKLSGEEYAAPACQGDQTAFEGNIDS